MACGVCVPGVGGKGFWLDRGMGLLWKGEKLKWGGASWTGRASFAHTTPPTHSLLYPPTHRQREAAKGRGEQQALGRDRELVCVLGAPSSSQPPPPPPKREPRPLAAATQSRAGTHRHHPIHHHNNILIHPLPLLLRTVMRRRPPRGGSLLLLLLLLLLLCPLLLHATAPPTTTGGGGGKPPRHPDKLHLHKPPPSSSSLTSRRTPAAWRKLHITKDALILESRLGTDLLSIPRSPLPPGHPPTVHKHAKGSSLPSEGGGGDRGGGGEHSVLTIDGVYGFFDLPSGPYLAVISDSEER